MVWSSAWRMGLRERKIPLPSCPSLRGLPRLPRISAVKVTVAPLSGCPGSHQNGVMEPLSQHTLCLSPGICHFFSSLLQRDKAYLSSHAKLQAPPGRQHVPPSSVSLWSLTEHCVVTEGWSPLPWTHPTVTLFRAYKQSYLGEEGPQDHVSSSLIGGSWEHHQSGWAPEERLPWNVIGWKGSRGFHPLQN